MAFTVPGILLIGGERKLTAALIAFKQDPLKSRLPQIRNGVITAD
jgi:hypothetical protein